MHILLPAVANGNVWADGCRVPSRNPDGMLLTEELVWYALNKKELASTGPNLEGHAEPDGSVEG